jgi:hypothetical protein
MEWMIVTIAAGLAGFVDSIVGGGGLVLVPAMFATYPGAAAATLLGNNKSASLWGTAFATWKYSTKVALPWKYLMPAALCAMAGAWSGAWSVGQISSDVLRKMLPLVLAIILIYTLIRKNLGQEHLPKWTGWQEGLILSFVGLLLGFYDGFFGPGTGSFLVFALVRFLGYDFLHASAGAKLLNTASNAAALLLFTLQGFIWWHLAIPMAVANILGSMLGTRMAIRHGSGFVRALFILIVSSLILKTGYDAYIKY